MECPYCHHRNLPNSRLCARCGRDFHASRTSRTAAFPTASAPTPKPPRPAPPTPEPELKLEPPPDPDLESTPSRDPEPREETEGELKKARPDYAGPSPDARGRSAPKETRSAAAGSPERSRRRIMPCNICKGLFPADDLIDFGGGYVCEVCLENKPELLAKTATQLRRIPQSDDRTHPKADRSKGIEDDRDTHDTYIHRRTYIDRYKKKQGHAPASTTLLWPKCSRHPDRSTRDRCRSCGKAICAMCIKRRGDLIYCPDCYHRSSQVMKAAPSGKYEGFSGSFFETIREVLFHPAVYFRNLPASGGSLQPFFFSLFAWMAGSIIALALLWFFAFREGAFDINTFFDNVLKPVLFGGLIGGALIGGLGWLPVHFLSVILGGKGSFNKSVRMFSLASAFHYLLVIPFIGWAIGVLISLLSFPRAIAESHEIDIARGFLVYLLFAAGVLGLYFAIATVLFTTDMTVSILG